MRAVNLIPVEQRTGAPVGAGRSQGGAYALLAIIAGLAIMAVLYGKADHAISSKQAQAASLAAQAQRAEAQANRLTSYTAFAALRQQRLQAVETLLESRFDWAHVFHEFGRVLPSGTSISSLDGSVGGSSSTAAATSASSPSSTTSASSSASASSSSATVASSTPPGAVPAFTISGCATGQKSVAELLERLRLIDGVKEDELESSTTSATSGGGGSSGGCPSNDPAYSIVVTFEALPSASAVAAASAPAATVSDKSATAASTHTETSTAGGGVKAR